MGDAFLALSRPAERTLRVCKNWATGGLRATDSELMDALSGQIQPRNAAARGSASIEGGGTGVKSMAAPAMLSAPPEPAEMASDRTKLPVPVACGMYARY